MIEKIWILQAGYCTHPEAVTLRGGKWCNCKFPAIYALIKHKTKGYILFDTGYTKQFFEASANFPLKIYQMITPVYLKEGDSAIDQLNKLGIEESEIKYIVVSHFHGDHISGLSDFTTAKYIFFDHAYQVVAPLTSFKALQKGFLPKLIPPDFDKRAHKINLKDLREVEYAPFNQGIDLFDDKSLVAVELPGHAKGQLGLFIKTKEQGIVFLAADTCWSSRAFQELILPHPVANILFDNSNEYTQTLSKLNELYKKRTDVFIIPSHCIEAANEFNGR